MSDRMSKSDQVRVQNARLGVARAAKELADRITWSAAIMRPTDGLDYLLSGITAAIEELRAAETTIRAPFAIMLPERDDWPPSCEPATPSVD